MIQGRRFMLALFYVNNTNHLTIINHQSSTINHQPYLQPKIIEIKPLFWILADNGLQ